MHGIQSGLAENYKKLTGLIPTKKLQRILMSSMLKRTLKGKRLGIVLVAILLLLLGCGGVGSTGGSFPIHAYPRLPLAMTDPGKVWLRCDDLGANPKSVEAEMYCVEGTHVSELQRFIRELDSIVRKYENATNAINLGN